MRQGSISRSHRPWNRACGTERSCMRHSSLMLDKTISHGTEQSLWDKPLSHMGQSSLMWDSPTRIVTSFKIILKLVEFFKIGWKSYKKYLGHTGRSTSFLTLYKIILKLVEVFTNCGESKKIFRTFRKVYKLCNFI